MIHPSRLVAASTIVVHLLTLLRLTSSKIIRPSNSNILIAGSANLDTFLPLKRLPTAGENLTLLPNTKPTIDVPGGKGCNQAIACSKLSLASSSSPKKKGSKNKQNNRHYFLSRLGDIKTDKSTSKLLSVLQNNNVNIDHCQQCTHMDCGRGYVFLEKESGKVSAVVSGGSNLYGWDDWQQQQQQQQDDVETTNETNKKMDIYLHKLFQTSQPRCLLLQREIPENVNYILASYVANVHNNKHDISNDDNKSKKKNRNQDHDDTIVLQDVGGEDRPMTKEMLSLCDYIMPNESELLRLVQTFISKDEFDSLLTSTASGDQDDGHLEHIIKLAAILQQNGANHVLVTLGDKGSVLIMKEKKDDISKDDEIASTKIHYQTACKLHTNNNIVVDETGAGDCYRAGFAVALSEGKDITHCMKFASAAGALAVTKEGAVPSIPSREEVEDLLLWNDELNSVSAATTVPRGGAASQAGKDNTSFPYIFGSRLNSMKDRPELWSEPVNDVREWVKRQGTIEGLGCIDFNWPQHFQSWDAKDAKVALDEVGLVAGSVCLRYPSKFARGAMIHPDSKLRREAIDLTKKAAEVARELGCDEVVVWSAYDGYDYPFQVDYNEKWDQIVKAFQECCDEYPDIKWSLEYKPTDENTRFFTIPSTGAAMLLLKDINRPNMGLTLDVGHMLMAGENPGQSIAMVGDKLFGIQLNDGYTRLAAEDGMMFGSIHPTMALEIMYQLQENKFSGHLYFDTFPQRTDPIKECEYNIKRVKEFWNAANQLNSKGIKGIMEEHDALGALNLINDAMKSV